MALGCVCNPSLHESIYLCQLLWEMVFPCILKKHCIEGTKHCAGRKRREQNVSPLYLLVGGFRVRIKVGGRAHGDSYYWPEIENQWSEVLLQTIVKRNQNALLKFIAVGLPFVLINFNLVGDPRPDDGCDNAAKPAQEHIDPRRNMNGSWHGKLFYNMPAAHNAPASRSRIIKLNPFSGWGRFRDRLRLLPKVIVLACQRQELLQ